MASSERRSARRVLTATWRPSDDLVGEPDHAHAALAQGHAHLEGGAQGLALLAAQALEGVEGAPARAVAHRARHDGGAQAGRQLPLAAQLGGQPGQLLVPVRRARHGDGIIAEARRGGRKARGVRCRMPRRLAATTVLALLCAACGGSPRRPPPPAPPPPPPERPLLDEALDRLPADTILVIGVDVARLSASPLVHSAWNRLAPQGPARQAAELLARCGFHVEDLGLAVIGAGQGKVVAAARGALREQALIGCVDQALTRIGAHMVAAEEPSGHVYHVDPPDSGRAWIAFLSEKTWMITNGGELMKVALGGGAHASGNSDLMTAVHNADSGRALWFAAPVPAELADMLMQWTSGALPEAPLRLAGAVDAGAELTITVRISFPSDKGASAAAGAAGMALTALRGSLPAALTAHLSADADGQDVVVRAVLDEAGLDALAGLAGMGRAD